MPWLNDVISKITGKKYDITDIKTKINTAAPVPDVELDAYIDDIDRRIKKMEKELRNTYSKYGVSFNGFKSLDTACDALRESLKDGKEVAYNNLLKLESSITSEQKRHLALLRIAMTSQGKGVLDEINRDPVSKEIYVKVFGERASAGKENMDGLYQRLWSEIHKLSEYIITQKNKVYH
jgi:hypothetical protein